MLETVREYGLEQLVAADEVEETHRTHATYFLAFAERAAPEWWGPEPAAWLDALEAERDNLREALRWAVAQREVQVGARLAIALHWLWRVRGPVSEGRQSIERVLAMCPTEPPLRAKLLTRAGDLAMVESDYPRAAELHEASLEIARNLGDRSTLAWALGFRGLTAVHEGNLERADEILTLALAEAREAKDLHWITAALDTRASIARRQGNLDQTVLLLEEALAIAGEARAAWHVANVMSHLGDVKAEVGDAGSADRLYRESLTQLWAIGDRRDFAGALAGFASLAARLGDTEHGARLCGAIEMLLQVVGVSLPPFGQTSYEHALKAARIGLEATVFEAARADGRALPPERVLAELERPHAFTISATLGTASRSGVQFGLTERELDVLRLLPSSTYQEIAERLFISQRTVEHHVRNICGKFRVHHRREAVEIGKRQGLI
jgi:ATP/maltotriose-dependent transcriptional regulator MalT